MKKLGIFITCSIALCGCNSNDIKYDATGTFEATEVTVSAEENGRIEWLKADEGSSVTVNLSMGQLDTTQLFLKRCQLQTNRKAVISKRPDYNKQIAALEQEIATAEKEQNRVSNLLKDGAANRKQLDDWDAKVKLLKRQLTALQSNLRNDLNSISEQGDAVTIEVAQVNDRLRKCHIQAPITGKVLARYAEAGEYATIGKPLFKLADMQNIFLRAYITSLQLNQVKVGDRVTVYADYGDDTRQKYNGTVEWIADNAEFTPKNILTKDERANQVYAVKIAVKNDGKIKLGMYGGVLLTPPQ